MFKCLTKTLFYYSQNDFKFYCVFLHIYRVSQPIFIGGLIRYYSGKTSDINEAYLYAGGIVLCSALNVLFMHPYMLSNLHIGMQLRVAMCSMIYRKVNLHFHPDGPLINLN